MQLSSYSDLSTSLQMRRENSALKSELRLAAREMTTGKVASVVEATAGNLQQILALDRKIELSETYQSAINMTRARTEAAQSAMTVISDIAGSLGPDLVASAGRGDATTRTTLAASSKIAFGAALVALNSRYAGSNLFGGAASDGSVVDSAAAILADVGAIVAAQPDGASAASAVSIYFNDPAGGFQTNRYFGSQQPGPRIRIGEDEVAAPLPTALDSGVLTLLEGLALAAVVDNGAFSASATDQNSLIGEAGRRLLVAQDQLQVLRSDIGMTNGRLAELEQTGNAETAALELVRNAIIGVDQFDAASRFEALRGQLETSYLATARLSQLTLSAFLR